MRKSKINIKFLKVYIFFTSDNTFDVYYKKKKIKQQMQALWWKILIECIYYWNFFLLFFVEFYEKALDKEFYWRYFLLDFDSRLKKWQYKLIKYIQYKRLYILKKVFFKLWTIEHLVGFKKKKKKIIKRKLGILEIPEARRKVKKLKLFKWWFSFNSKTKFGVVSLIYNYKLFLRLRHKINEYRVIYGDIYKFKDVFSELIFYNFYLLEISNNIIYYILVKYYKYMNVMLIDEGYEFFVKQKLKFLFNKWRKEWIKNKKNKKKI